MTMEMCQSCVTWCPKDQGSIDDSDSFWYCQTCWQAGKTPQAASLTAAQPGSTPQGAEAEQLGSMVSDSTHFEAATPKRMGAAQPKVVPAKAHLAVRPPMAQAQDMAQQLAHFTPQSAAAASSSFSSPCSTAPAAFPAAPAPAPAPPTTGVAADEARRVEDWRGACRLLQEMGLTDRANHYAQTALKMADERSQLRLDISTSLFYLQQLNEVVKQAATPDCARCESGRQMMLRLMQQMSSSGVAEEPHAFLKRLQDNCKKKKDSIDNNFQTDKLWLIEAVKEIQAARDPIAKILSQPFVQQALEEVPAQRQLEALLLQQQHQLQQEAAQAALMQQQVAQEAELAAALLQSQPVQQAMEYPRRPGAQPCQYYMTTGDCSYGPTCRWDHPPRQPPSCNSAGFPLRPDQGDCSFYIRTGKCQYGVKCRFNHPEKGVVAAPAVAAAACTI
eukprot:TRINITY_DN4629_c0_g1_i3.p1 TRINITY_DN4629_c0_g1~~TRINITY_DN4629_c0_g1_i3.p1  ORF type:complete len:446 (+),score=110.35 TRINITY_DN4629_c0_g1_i3:200-1537(+)